MSIMLNLVVKPRCKELEQLQLTVSHEQVVSLLQAAGAPEKTALSRKKGKILTLTVKTPKGDTVTWRQMDTHAIWVNHQDEGKARDFLAWIFQNNGLTVEVVDAVYSENVTVTEAVAPVATADDCPF